MFDFENVSLISGGSWLKTSWQAKIKSSFGYQKTHLPCFADDSGICIEALNWGPGIKSKRFLNKFKNK